MNIEHGEILRALRIGRAGGGEIRHAREKRNFVLLHSFSHSSRVDGTRASARPPAGFHILIVQPRISFPTHCAYCVATPVLKELV